MFDNFEIHELEDLSLPQIYHDMGEPEAANWVNNHF